MSTASLRALMRQLTVAFLLLLGRATDGRVGIVARRHHGSAPAVAAASHGALLAAAPVRSVGNDVDTAPAPVLAAEASRLDRRVHSAPAPTHDASSLRAGERTAGQAARPPPVQL
jgi:hypothetical protein